MLLVCTATGAQSLGPDHIAEQHGGSEDPADVELANLDDVQEMIGVFNVQFAAVLALKET